MESYSGNRTDFYLAPAHVAELVNLAMVLRRPLLVEGEPGCGKTTLAYSVAAELGLRPPIRISIKSTSRARDLLYRFDTIRRLQDAQGINNARAQSIYPYISLGPLGEAIHERSPVSVVLLDEIDKADIDFPNDILDVLDDYSFTVDDLPTGEEARCLADNGFGRQVRSGERRPPIIIITSNREKRLPEPFLRRCLFAQLRFPDDAEELRIIVGKNLKVAPADVNQSVLTEAIQSFCAIRKRSLEQAAIKPPATSELIDWVKALLWGKVTPAEIKANPPRWWRTLFKVQQDIEAYEASPEGAAIKGI
jgi:MoxR-like ATPase